MFCTSPGLQQAEARVASQRKWPGHGLYLVKFKGTRQRIYMMFFTDAEGYRCGVAGNWISAPRCDDWTSAMTSWVAVDCTKMPKEKACTE